MRTRSSGRLAGWFVTLTVIAALAVTGASSGPAAAQSTPEISAPIRIVWPAPDAEVVGRDVAVSWQAPGLRIVPAAEAESETDYHAHFLVDGVYDVTEGEPIPQQCGVLHTAANPATLMNLAPGEHTIQLVIADPGHVPVPGLDRPAVTFTVAENPDAIRITSPENCQQVPGPDVEIAWEAPGLTIAPAADAQNETDLHAHFIVDGAYEVVAGEPIPMQDGVIHTAANPVMIEGLAPGQHTIQLVIGDPGHVPVPALARPQLTIIVGEAAAAGTPTGVATPEEGAEATPDQTAWAMETSIQGRGTSPTT
jgi:Domain of unknown function (DUF4399)/Family of unknown function (DUF6130)